MNEQLFGWNEQTWLYLDQLGILAGNVMLLFSLCAVVFGWLRRDNIRRWFSRNRFPHIGGKPEGKDWQGLVFTVSRDELPCWVIGQLRPKRIGLLVTDHSEAAGKRIQAYAEQQGIAVHRRMIENADDPNEVYLRTRELLQLLRGEESGRLAIDITGGKVPMSLGAFMAAEEAGVDSLYVSTRFEQGRPDMRSASITSVSRTQ
ncbi:PDDEXK family nuclease [Methylomarinum vadi]|uniref:hypothetical protein n=1 Tax=Methylomarinum vadi TaxID=438855 RepID=UPI0004DF6CB4|nr:hypothetical protein [Methylomarinum vadi]